MTLFHAVVLAIVQGLTEFLPISSSAHLWFFPWALHWPDGGLPFDVALHAGTLAAVLFYFLGTWIELVLNGIGVRYPAQASDEQCRTQPAPILVSGCRHDSRSDRRIFIRAVYRGYLAQSRTHCRRHDRGGPVDGSCGIDTAGCGGFWNK